MKIQKKEKITKAAMSFCWEQNQIEEHDNNAKHIEKIKLKLKCEVIILIKATFKQITLG